MGKADFCKDDAAAAKLLYTNSPRDAKDIESSIDGLADTDWDQKKNGFMEEILRCKFSDNDKMKKQLLDTNITITITITITNSLFVHMNQQ